MRRLREEDALDLVLDDSGAVSIGGETIGQLEGFRFAADPRAEGIHGRTLRAAALKGLEGEFYARTQRLASAATTDITLSEHGKLWWDGAIVGQLEAGASALAPRVVLNADEQLRAELRAQLQTKLDTWLSERIAARLSHLIELRNAADAKPGTPDALPAEARGIAHQLCENLGSLDRTSATLPPDERAALRALRQHGVRFARRSIYLPRLIRPDAAALLALLWAVKHRVTKIPPPPNAGITSFEVRSRNAAMAFWPPPASAASARAPSALDMLDRLEQELEAAATSGATADAMIPKLVSLIGSDRATLDISVLAALGWSRIEVANAEGADKCLAAHTPRPRRHEHHKPKHTRKPEPKITARPDSPFASALGQPLLKR